MIKLNDYLYSGSTVLRILKNYTRDLGEEAETNQDPIGQAHCRTMTQLYDLLQHTDFLRDQSQRIHEFYQYMTQEYPHLAFIFKGRIKSLIRVEEKFNGYVVSNVYKYYVKNGEVPPVDYLCQKVDHFRDLIAYRIVISMPKCKIPDQNARRREEIRILYEIANRLPGFLQERGFVPERIAKVEGKENSPRLDPEITGYYKDYIANPSMNQYQSLHITLYDETAKCYVEVQLRTKEMDDVAEIGSANHFGYERMQATERRRRDAVPEGLCPYFDEAYERVVALQQMELSELDVNMFSAANNHLVNDCCGLLRGRLILPFEHLSDMQSE